MWCSTCFHGPGRIIEGMTIGGWGPSPPSTGPSADSSSSAVIRSWRLSMLCFQSSSWRARRCWKGGCQLIFVLRTGGGGKTNRHDLEGKEDVYRGVGGSIGVHRMQDGRMGSVSTCGAWGPLFWSMNCCRALIDRESWHFRDVGCHCCGI